jgi:hypothetical protein
VRLEADKDTAFSPRGMLTLAIMLCDVMLWDIMAC